MKKLLLGTTALIGAVAVAASASAQEPLSVTLGGYLQFDAASVSQENDGDYNSHDFRTSTEVHVRAEGTTDAGLTYGAVIELEGDDDNTVTDATPYNDGDGSETHIYLSGGWGKLQLGNMYGPASTRNLGLTAPGDFGLGGVVAVEESYRDFLVETGSAQNNEAIGWLGKVFETMNAQHSTKIAYYTPVFNGFQVGASYAPEGNTGDDTSREDTITLGGTSIPAAVDDYGSYFEVAALWNYAFGNNVGLGLSGNYVFADAEDDVVANERADINAFTLGANVTFGGFTVGMSYSDLDDSGLIEGSALDYDNTEGFTFGVQYETGPFVVGANYLMANTDAARAGVEDVEYDALSFGGSWAVAPGFVTYAEATFYDFEGDTNSTTSDDDGSVIVLGTRVSF